MSSAHLNQITLNAWQIAIGVLGLLGIWLSKALTGANKFGRLEQSVCDLKGIVERHIEDEKQSRRDIDKKLEHLQDLVFKGFQSLSSQGK